jgi:hypothetical protein
MKLTRIWINLALAAALGLTGSAWAAQTSAPATAKEKKSTAKTAAPATPAATDAEIADAKAKGMVWVNTGSGKYHKGGEWYGKTKQGKFMTEADAQKAGYKASKENAPKTKDTTKK